MNNRLEDFRIGQTVGPGCLKCWNRSLPVRGIDCQRELENGRDLRIGRLSLLAVGSILGAHPSRARSAGMCDEAIITAVCGCDSDLLLRHGGKHAITEKSLAPGIDVECRWCMARTR
ncbi:hypothetical protein FHW00_004109 [Ochrobactrum sp. P6BSIII]|nr:hypothetical protein [Ochrobactrum sp. P6BSIII]